MGDVVGLVDLADTIFGGEGLESEIKLTFEEFCEYVLQLHGSNTATVKDIVDLRKLFHRNAAEMETCLDDATNGLGEEIVNMIDVLVSELPDTRPWRDMP